jgi:Asp-tRNA(Asn)/Glu-tRNA(Gln) amidotransferase A subunit family amidase
LALEFCHEATGGDGGDSTRSRAAFCGLVGLKPTAGRIPKPRTTVSGLSCPAALVQSVRDCARHLDVAREPHPLDRASLPGPACRYEDVIDALDVAGLRVVWSDDLGFAPVQPGVRDLARAAAEDLVVAGRLRWTSTDRIGLRRCRRREGAWSSPSNCG